MWLLSISILLNCFLFFKVWMSAWAPSLSISLLESYNSSRQAHLAMNSQIVLHPFEVILLSDMLKTWRLCFFLLERALITIDTPSSPILFPLKFSSFIVFERAKQSSRLLIPWSPISFFLRLKTSKYFLSLRDYPIATAPSAKIPFKLMDSSVMYFLFKRTLLTALAPPGPMKFYDSMSSLNVLYV